MIQVTTNSVYGDDSFSRKYQAYDQRARPLTWFMDYLKIASQQIRQCTLGHYHT